MNELIKVTNQGDKQTVSARELYEFLEFAPQHYSNWYKRNILDNQFAVENDDYSLLPLNGSKNKRGKKAQDFAITLDFAKKIAMMANTEKGNEARDYFLRCEEIAMGKKVMQELTPKDMAKMWLAAEEEKERLQEENEFKTRQLELKSSKIELLDTTVKQQAPKVKYHDEVLSSDSTFTTTTIAKELGMSAMALHSRLKGKQIMFYRDGHWVLYAKFQDKDYTKTRTHTFTNPYGETRTSITTVWTEKGREFLHSVFNPNLSVDKNGQLVKH